MKRAIFFLLFFILSANALAISMNQLSPEERIVIFEPYFEKDFQVNIYNADNIQGVIYPGVLEPYATLIDPDPLGGPRSLTMRLSLPDTLPPGNYEVLFGGKEYYNSAGGTIGGLAAVLSRVTVLSLYDGLFPTFSIRAEDMGKDSKMNISVSIENFGTQDIQGAYATIDIYDPNNNLVTTLKTNNAIVPSKKVSLAPVVVQAVFDSSKFNINPGYYTAIATLSYDGNIFPEKKNATFRLGTLDVTIKDWTKVVYANVTNKFVVTIESDWSGSISNVYARITVPNDQTLKTPNLDLDKFQTANLETYWETKKLELKNYTVTIEVFYAGTSTKKDVQVEVIMPIEPVEEKPSMISLSPMNIGIIVLVILIALNVYFFVFKKNNGNNGNGTNGTSNQNDPKNNGSQNRIQPPKM